MFGFISLHEGDWQYLAVVVLMSIAFVLLCWLIPWDDDKNNRYHRLQTGEKIKLFEAFMAFTFMILIVAVMLILVSLL